MLMRFAALIASALVAYIGASAFVAGPVGCSHLKARRGPAVPFDLSLGVSAGLFILARRRMDNVTLIRIVAGVLAAVVVVILGFRMKMKAPR